MVENRQFFLPTVSLFSAPFGDDVRISSRFFAPENHSAHTNNPCSFDCVMIRLVALTQYQRVTDIPTDARTDRIAVSLSRSAQLCHNDTRYKQLSVQVRVNYYDVSKTSNVVGMIT